MSFGTTIEIRRSSIYSTDTVTGGHVATRVTVEYYSLKGTSYNKHCYYK